MRRSREAATRLHPGRQPWVIGIRHYSPPCKGGVDERSRKCREATLVRADGVARSASPIGRSLKKRSAKSLGLKSFAELTTPSAALRTLRAFLLMPQPPLLFKKGNVSALKQSVHSFTRSEILGAPEVTVIDVVPEAR